MEISFSNWGILKAVLIAVAVFMVIVAADVVVMIGLALVFALGLNPLVERLTDRGLGRGKAALLVFFVLFAAASIIIIWAATPIWEETKQLVDNGPAYVEDLSNEPAIEELAQSADFEEKATEVAEDLARAIPEAASALLGLTGSLIGSALSIVTLTFLTLFLLIGLPDLTRAATEIMTPAAAARTDRLVAQVSKVICDSLIGNLVISVIAGTVVGVTAVLIDAPFPIVLAVIAGVLDLIPQVGSMIAAIIIVAITLAGTGAGAAVIMLVVILVYQQVENYVIQPLVYREAVELSGFATIAVVMAGGALLGVMGAILAVPVAASLKIVIKDLTSERRERMAALRPAA